MKNYMERVDTVGELLDYMKKHDLEHNDKDFIYNLAMNLKKKTDLQKDRFIRYYGLKKPDYTRESMSNIAKERECQTNAVRVSVLSIRCALFRVPEEDYERIKLIHKKYVK